MMKTAGRLRPKRSNVRGNLLISSFLLQGFYNILMTGQFKPAFRFLWKRKSFAFLNIFGLAVGIAASLVIFLLIKNEFSYDRYHKNEAHIYRLVTEISNRNTGEIIERNKGVPVPLSAAVRNDFPELKAGVIASFGQAQVYVPGASGTPEDEKRFKENEGLFWAEPQFFDMFDFNWIAGNASRLKEPNTLVIQESFAKRYFGSAQEAIGRRVELWSFRIPLQVVGVYKDIPSNTDLPVQFAGSYATLLGLYGKRDDPMTFWDFTPSNTTCYLYAPGNADIESVTARLPAFVSKYYKDKPEIKRSLVPQPLVSIHLNEDFNGYTRNRLLGKELWSLGLIGAFLLLVACVNFINLSTAQSVNRAREIGVRKVLGSNRKQLVSQFLQETAIITFFALLVGVSLAALSLPFVNGLMHKGLSLDLIHEPAILFYLLITGILVTLLAGSYPALVLSGFSPSQVFRSKLTGRSNAGIYLRRSLVVFQFVVAQLLIIATIVVVRQMDFFRNQPIGIEKDGIVLVNLPSDSALKTRYPSLVSRIERVDGVQSASLCMDAPTTLWGTQEDLYYQGEPIKKDFTVTHQFADTGYFRTFGINLLAGRIPFFSDSTVELVVNETLVNKLGIRDKHDILGRQLSFDGEHRFTVVGVCRDYNSLSLREAIVPLVISSEYDYYEWIAIRTSRGNFLTTLDNIHKTFSSIYPTYMYDQVFFDEQLETFYQYEGMVSQLFKVFAGLAILISCLGLYGLISFMAVQKTKEVGIRKVLGASVRSIMFLFSREFTWLIITAFLIAAPVGYFLMKKWLQGFYYHINLGWIIFLLAIISTLIIAWMTVGYKAFRAAVVNPVKSLRSE
ncbi:MAG: FtsX-like permease family protein [Chitinophagaceae bacterium]|nr:MAG: FtsX-like permease family protein [Chitinophagaceae bacterium]